ncbi:MAG: hypothetical protein ABMB14_03785 [Myxococcota bacterium]
MAARRGIAPWLGVALAACSGGTGGAPECTALVDGEWVFDGAALGMAMSAIVSMDVDGCTFAIADWTMEMGSIPSGGVVDGDAITLDGDDLYWASCVGTVGADGKSAEGACDDGADFVMTGP